MKNFTQKFIGLVFLLFAMSFKVNAQDNYSLNFNNNADRVEIPADMLNGLVDFTISSTFKADSGQTGYSCIFQYDPINANNASSMYGRYYQGDNLFEFTYGNAVIDISPVPSFDEWHNIISVCEGDTIKVYLNGDLVGISSYNSSLEFLPSESDILYIGNWNTSENFDGLISDFQIWNKALTPEEIESYRTCHLTGEEEGLAALWNFNEGSGYTVYDISGNGNHGVIYGAEFNEDVPENNCNELEEVNDSLVSSCIQIIDLHLDHSGGGGYLNEGISLILPDGVIEEYCDGNCSTGNWPPVNHQPYVQCQNMANTIQEFSSYFDAECVSQDTLRIITKDYYEESPYLEVSNCGNSCGIWSVNGITNPQEPIAFDCVQNNMEGFSYGGFFNNSYYYVSQELASWEAANIICNSSGGYLATSESALENDIISSLVNNLGPNLDDAWFGLTLDTISENWNWIDDSELSYTNWANNEPSGTDANNNNENYGLIHISGTWNDGYGLTDHQYIMEIDAIYGCLDSEYYNYNPQVNTDDGSCMSYEEFLIDSLQQALAVFETVEEFQDYSMSFDGDDDYVNVPTSNSIDDLSTELSISAWIYPTNYSSNGSHPRIIHRTEQYGGTSERWFLTWCPNTNGWNAELQFGIGSGGDVEDLHTTSSIPLNEWSYVSVSFNNGSVSLLVNGQTEFEGISPYSSVEHVQGVDVRIASALNNSFFPGKINYLELWNKALTQEQIQSYMSCPPTGQEEGLVGYWNFNEGSGDTVYDISGNENHSVIYGAEFSEDVPESYNGCTDENALNFDAEALCDNGSCVYGDDVVTQLEDSFNQTVSALNNDLDSTNSTLNEVIDTWQSSIDLTNATLDEVSQMNQTIASFTTLIDLQEGWNMIGYGCPEPVNIEQGMSMYTDLVLLIKDNNGSVYLPEFNFNGIGDFTPGYGYQLKVSEPIEDFGLCGDYTNTESPEITDIETDNAQMQNDINCLTGNPEIGDHCYGGIVFYVEQGDEGKYGLVAAIDDLPGFYEFGCSNQVIVGADGLDIGYGYQNTNDILNQECITQNGNLSASEAASLFESNLYDDWYLPSIEELKLILNSNISSFQPTKYWSSSETGAQTAYPLDFLDFTSPSDYLKYATCYVRPIRSFGNWTMGCMDSLACNYNPEANMADGSCVYPEQGYDCEGNITAQIGEVMEGGYLFYIDSTGKHGLVAAMEDLTEGATDLNGWGNGYEWGCYEQEVNGAEGTAIGTGYQNTIDIVNQGCITENGGITAAQAALDAETNDYSDWYLPSKDELWELYSTIGPVGPEGNIGGFQNSFYWSSSEYGNSNAWIVNFYSGLTFTNSKTNIFRVRVIRAF